MKIKIICPECGCNEYHEAVCPNSIESGCYAAKDRGRNPDQDEIDCLSKETLGSLMHYWRKKAMRLEKQIGDVAVSGVTPADIVKKLDEMAEHLDDVTPKYIWPASTVRHQLLALSKAIHKSEPDVPLDSPA